MICEEAMTPHDETRTSEQRLHSNQEWKGRNRDYILAYNKRRNAKVSSDPVLRAKRDLSTKVSKQKPHVKAAAKKYEQMRVSTPAVRARRNIRNRIYKGYLTRQPCVICGTAQPHAHHEDYNKPLSIVWLCNQHHRQVHTGLLVITKEQIVDV